MRITRQYGVSRRVLCDQALERALARHPSTMPAAERWSAIANDVPGKTRKECVERFKQVCCVLFFIPKKHQRQRKTLRKAMKFSIVLNGRSVMQLRMQIRAAILGSKAS